MLEFAVLASSASSHSVYYVKPNDSTPSCPGQPCLTIDQYASQGERYLITGASFLFLPGNHSTSSTLHLQNISDVIFKRKENISSVIVSCRSTKPFILYESVTNITIHGLILMLSTENLSGTSSALEVFNSKEILLRNLAFRGRAGSSRTLARAAILSHSDVEIISCYFEENTGDYGGAIYASDGSNVTLGGNVFNLNKATISGGAIFANNSYLIMKEGLGNTFTRNSAEFDGGAIYCFCSTLAIVTELTSAERAAQRASEFEVCTNEQAQENSNRVDIHTTYFSHNKANSKSRDGGGGAIYVGKSVVSLNGTVIIFHNNSANNSGGAMNSHVSKVALNTVYLCFIRNSARNGGAYFGSNGTLQIAPYKSELAMIKDNKLDRSLNIFACNRAIKGGGALSSIGSNTTFGGKAIHFVDNSARNGGGVYIGETSQLVISAEELKFVNNSAQYCGGGLLAFSSIVQVNSKRLVSINFTKNRAFHGGALGVLQSNLSFSGDLTMYKNVGSGIGATGPSTISLTGNTVFEENWAGPENGGAIKMSMKTDLLISGILLFRNNTTEGNGGAIFAFNSNIIISNISTFISNRASNGGAMYFEYGATMSLKQNTTLNTSYNHASKYGGAIYHKDIVGSPQCQFAYSEWTRNEDVSNLPSCFLLLLQLSMSHAPYLISSHEDSSGIDGSFIYGGLTDKCQLTANDDYGYHPTVLYPILLRLKVLKITSNSTTTAKNITSEVYELCFCENSQKYNCTKSRSIRTYRGQKFTMTLLALVQGNTTATSLQLVRAKLSGTARIRPLQIQQILGRNCADISYNIYSREEREQLVMYLADGPCHDSGVSKAVINVTLLPCPNGFTLTHDQCTCEERLLVYKADCIIDDDGGIYIAKKAGSKFWVNASYSNGTYQGLILYPTCPLWYCKTVPINISLSLPDVQCDHNRSGVLCGACIANYSLMLGSSKCQACSNIYLILLLPFAASGIILVFVISVFRLTVANGMINSILLYANILQANRSLFFPSSTNTNVLTVFIAWMNLDLGFETCFYNGMDAYAQTWLQFAFPLYVWFLISLIILTSRYSIRVTKLIGSDPVAVLATLLLMSYTKILKIIIEVYSSVDLDYPDSKTMTMWLKDSNVPYMQSWHLALTIVTTLVLIFLFLPYTLLLLIGYKLFFLFGRKYSRCLNRIKPLLDSYYAPYKMHTRNWTGFLLLVRCSLYMVFSFNSLRGTSRSLLATNIVFALTIACLSVKVYSNMYTNAIEVIVYSNLIALSSAALAGVNSPPLVNSLVGMVFAIMMGIFAYQFHVLTSAKSIKFLAKLTFTISAVMNRKASEKTPLLDPAADNSTQPQRPAGVTKSACELF